MQYTNHTAGMTLGTARDIIENPEKGWTADQTARARAVVNHWARIRKAQAKRKGTNAIVAHGPDGKVTRVIELSDEDYNALERAMQWPEDLEAYDRLNTPIQATLEGWIINPHPN